jgi:hypothetical protein
MMSRPGLKLTYVGQKTGEAVRYGEREIREP